MLWTVTVNEIVENTVEYTIEAENADEAKEKASRGETESEETLRVSGVIDRMLITESAEQSDFEVLSGPEDNP